MVENKATIDLYLMAAIYVLAGLNHFRAPAFYRPMMPPWIPAHDFCIYASGVAEIVCGAMLLLAETQSLAAWGVIAMLVVFMPVHIYMLQERNEKFRHIPSWILFLRLPMQFILMWWAYLYV